MAIMKRYGQVISLPIKAISPDLSKGRQHFEPEAMCALADSIQKYGVLQPITVRRIENGYGLVAGERRLKAAKMAGLTRIPCILVDADDIDTSILALVENLHRRDLDFIQEAEALHQLISNHGLSQEETARRLGRSQSAVANKLRILKLSGETLYLIREAGLTERHARALLRLESDTQRMQVLEQIVTQGLNVAKTDELVDTILTGGEKPPRPIYIIRDVQMFLNSVTKGVSIMKQSGIHAQYGRDDTDTDIVVTVKIPKMM